MCVGCSGFSDARSVSEVNFIAFAQFSALCGQWGGHAVIDGVLVGVGVLLAAERRRIAHLHVSEDNSEEADQDEDMVILHGCGIQSCVVIVKVVVLYDDSLL